MAWSNAARDAAAAARRLKLRANPKTRVIGKKYFTGTNMQSYYGTKAVAVWDGKRLVMPKRRARG